MACERAPDARALIRDECAGAARTAVNMHIGEWRQIADQGAEREQADLEAALEAVREAWQALEAFRQTGTLRLGADSTNNNGGGALIGRGPSGSGTDDVAARTALAPAASPGEGRERAGPGAGDPSAGARHPRMRT